MPRSGSFCILPAALFAAALVCVAPVRAQAPNPIAVETRDLPPPAAEPAAPPAAPVEAAPSPPAASGTPAPAAAAPTAPRALTLIAPPPVDPSVPDQVTLVSKPSLVLKGASSWEEGYEKLRAAFRTLDGEAAKAGLAVVGRPVALFVETDEQGFRYEALLPVESLPSQRPQSLSPEVRLGATPEGRAFRFVHQASYEEIDSTYEAITAYLDLKGIDVKDTLIEEYVELGKDAGDGAIEINIYVQPRK
jgi:effector-binding domain-containing protein